MDVYVFGAGASAPYNAPTMNQFLSRAFWPWLTTVRGSTDFDDELVAVAKAIDQRYGTDLTKAQRSGSQLSAEAAIALTKLNLEELLAVADETHNPGLRHGLERVIYKTLERSLRVAIQNKDPNREYETLIRQLVRSANGVCLVSFNYDWMLDRALVEESHTTNITWTYGLPFSAGIDNFPSYRHVDNSRVHLLKLHGSVNWSQCVGCKSLRLYYFILYDNIYRSSWRACKTCSGTDFRPVLVAPTPLKNIPDVMSPAWGKAAQCLRAAQNLTVIGYSFPTFDRKARDLFLKDFIVPNLYSDSRPKLTVVLRDKRARETVRDWFLPAVDKNTAEYCSFEEYCANLSIRRGDLQRP